MTARDKLAAFCYLLGAASALAAGFLVSLVAGFAALAVIGLLSALLLGWGR